MIGRVEAHVAAELALLRRARDLMDREYAAPLDVPALARRAHMSAAHFSRRFAAVYGESPHAYLRCRRVERAMALLRAGSSVTDACAAVGATSLGSFSAGFRRIAGMSPSKYASLDHSAVRRMPGWIAAVRSRPAASVGRRSSRNGEAPAPAAS